MNSPEENKDLVVQSWLGKIQDWNVSGCLPLGLELADGRKVEEGHELGYYEQGNPNFGSFTTGPDRYNFAIRDLKEKRPGASVISNHDFDSKHSLITYWTDWKTSDITNRSSEYGTLPGKIQFLFDKSDIPAFLTAIKQNPKLMDRIIGAKFPKLVENRNFKEWSELIYVPPEVNAQNYQQKMQILSKHD